MNDLDYKKIGLEMKRLRLYNAYTQEQVADDLGCTVSFVSNIENNHAKLNLRVLMYYSKLCNVSIDSILRAGAERPENSSEDRDIAFLNLLHEFSPEDQEKLLKIMKCVKETLL